MPNYLKRAKCSIFLPKTRGMFGNNKSKDSGRGNSIIPSSTSHSLNSLVQGTVVEGNINCKSDIRNDGSIKGSLNCGAKVIIGPTVSVEGDVICKSAVVEGSFDGKLNASELLNIRESANVNGEIRYGKLIVQPGAVLVGDVRMNGTSVKSNHLKSAGSNSVKGQDASIPGKAKLQKESANR